MYRNFKTDEEKDEIARSYLAKRSEKKRNVQKKWFPGPACRVSKIDNRVVLKAGPDYSAIATLKDTEEWANEDTQVVEACTVRWVKECFDDQTELRVAKVPYLHGVLWQDATATRNDTLLLCDETGQVEVRLHEHLRARYYKVRSLSHSDPAILMKKVTIFRSDSGHDFYACCALANFIHLVSPDRKKDGNDLPSYPNSFPLQYGSQDLSELGSFPETNHLPSTYRADEDVEGLSATELPLLLPRSYKAHFDTSQVGFKSIVNLICKP